MTGGRVALLSTVLLGVVLMACAQQPAPPGAGPPRAAEGGAERAAPASSGAGQPAPASAGGQSSLAAADVEWERVVAAARQEGKLVLAGPAGEYFREVVGVFRAAYPEIDVEAVGGGGAQLLPRILGERRAGQFLWDAFVTGSSTGFQLAGENTLVPLKSALVLADVQSDSKWFGGFDAGFQDKMRQYIYAFEGAVTFQVFVNRDVVPESQLRTIEQLAEPQWKGRISWLDPRAPGGGATSAGQLLLVMGEEFYRQLLAQDVIITGDRRQMAEWMVRGRYPIAVALTDNELIAFQKEGLGLNVQPLEPKRPGGYRVSSSTGTVFWFERAPHPNAAKLFINWLLSQSGQAAWARAAATNSRRLDVEPGAAERALYPGIELRSVNDEEYFAHEVRAREIASETLRQ
jgi:iron(III) transport system substrate-binding protein